MKNRSSSGKSADGAIISDENAVTYSKINSMRLIQLVRSNEALYNSDAEGYSDKNHKEIVWERIHKSLFPKYDTLGDHLQDLIRGNVRRRWKTLRNAIAREVKKNATVENYCRKKESPIIAELEFLIPHIRSAHCAKLADELGLRESYATMNETDEPDEEDFNDLIDLTEEFDIKPIIKLNASYQFTDSFGGPITFDAAAVSSDSQSPIETLYPHVQLNSGGGAAHKVEAADWTNEEYCSVAQYKEGEFTNATVLCTTSHETDDQSDPGPGSNKPNSPPTGAFRKRARTELIEDQTELQAKILQLLTNLERQERHETRADQDAHDEDRMFLLSLVSDLKRVPPAKKMLVKAEIATAIARAIP